MPPLAAAARLVAYAMATACLTGLPAATSALMFLRKASLLEDLTRGIVYYAQWISEKLMTIASDSDPPEMFRTVMDAEPTARLDTQQLYAPAVAPAATFKIRMSLTLIRLLFSVNVTLVAVASAAPFMVIWPAGLFSVTAVDLLVACVTVPCPAAV